MRARITIRSGPQTGKEHHLSVGEGCVLGRGTDTSFQILDADASRRHVLLELTAQGLNVTDLGSRNGSSVDGQLLVAHEPRLVNVASAVLGIGATAIELELDTPPGQAAAAGHPEGTVQGDYENLGELGRGAAGTVFAARHRASGKTVALKALHPRLEEDPDKRERFMREAKLRLRSPHVVEVYEVRVEAKQVFLIMELVQGQPVDALLKNGALPIAQALTIGEHVAQALTVAHSQQVVHRDVKPENILVTPEGVAKLTDFGIAKLLDAESGLTATGTGMGTLAYVSPEQTVDASSVSPRTDLYSLGATLYHMIAGETPFKARSPRILIAILQKQPPDLCEKRPDCPPPVRDFVNSLLAKKPDDRPANATIVANRLRHLRTTHYGS